MARLPNQFGGAAPWPGQTGRAGQIPTTRAPKQAGGFYGGAGQAATTRAPSFYGGMGRPGGQAGGGMPQQMGAPMGFAGGQRPRPLPRPIGGNQGGGMGQNLLATGGALGNMATPDEINEARARQGKAPLPSSFWGDRGGVFLFQKPGPGGGGGVRPLWDPTIPERYKWKQGQNVLNPLGREDAPVGTIFPWPVDDYITHNQSMRGGPLGGMATMRSQASPGGMPQQMGAPMAVSYTHLTLPTIYSV